MAELKDREKEERELQMLLLLLFGSQDIQWWLSGHHSPQWFEQELRRIGLRDTLLSTSQRAKQGLLAEVGYDSPPPPYMARRGAVTADVFTHDIAGRLSKHHRQWLDELNRLQNEYSWRLRRGETVPDFPFPRIDDIYDVAKAKREAESTVTDIVSETEIESVRDIERELGIRLMGFWRTESKPCERCEKLRDTSQEVWSREAPRGPKLHPHCKCWLEWLEVL